MSIKLQIGCASRPKPGESACGDQTAIIHDSEGVLIAVVDGLGHGPEAEKAALAACAFVRDNSAMDLSSMMKALDRAIAATRGAAVTLVRVSPKTGGFKHVAVGNVEWSSLRRLERHPLTVPGVVGARYRKVVQTRGRLVPGDIVVLYTDGISSRFDLESGRNLGAQAVADHLLDTRAKAHDDATCVVIKLLAFSN